MKKIIVLVAALFTICPAIHAQDNKPPVSHEKNNRTPEDRARKDAERAQKELALDAAQTAKWQNASLERINANAVYKTQMKTATDPAEKQKIASQMKPNQNKV